MDFFRTDVAKAFDAARNQAREMNRYNVDMIASLTGVNFQLGTGWVREFSNTWAYLKSGNFSAAISNLKMSLWNKQTPVRVASFISTLQQQNVA